jgi:Aspartyl/Asparaginyl beta-hydroxylase
LNNETAFTPQLAIELLQQTSFDNLQPTEVQSAAIKVIRNAVEAGQDLDSMYLQLEQAARNAKAPQVLYLLGAQTASASQNVLRELQCWHQVQRLQTHSTTDLNTYETTNSGLSQGLSTKLAGDLGFVTPEQWQQSQTDWQSRRAQFIRDTYSDIRTQHGARALFRIDRALAGYLGEASVFSSQANQKPKFIYVPGLPDTGFHNAYEHPCAGPLSEQVSDLQNEFIAYQNIIESAKGAVQFEPYMELAHGAAMSDFVGGSNPQARWDAVFFYRHGQRIESNHALCPKTSAAIDALPLVRIKDQTPEICFSVMQPGTTIKAHHGVSNARLVMHIPLIVPDGAYLELPGVGKHFWKEGQAMLFDDTFLHLAQNPASSQRVILLMDVWNHHLKDFEIEAFKALIEAISNISQVGVVRE